MDFFHIVCECNFSNVSENQIEILFEVFYRVNHIRLDYIDLFGICDMPKGSQLLGSPLNSIVYECVCVSVVQFCCIGSMMGKYNSIKLRPECATHMNIHFHLSIRRFCEGNNSYCITSIEMHTHLTRCQHWKYNIFSGLVCVHCHFAIDSYNCELHLFHTDTNCMR